MTVRRPCLAKRLYAQATPYVQLGGWFAVAVPALYTAFCFYTKVLAYEGRIAENAQANQQQEARINALEREQAETRAQIRFIYDWVRDMRAK